MFIRLPTFVALIVVVTPCFGQRDAPVWESYLASVTVTHGGQSTVDIDLLFKKEGGPYEHTHHQMYLIAYLAKNESEVLKTVANKKWLDKTRKGDMFLDVLLNRRLATVLETKLAKRSSFAAQDTIGKYRDGSSVNQGKPGLQINAFRFAFQVKYDKLFDAVSQLKGFEKSNVFESDATYFEDKCRFLVYVPVNDCRYATQRPKSLDGKHDFANYKPETESDEESFYRKTPVLYCKPLAHVLGFKRLKNGRFLVYIN